MSSLKGMQLDITRVVQHSPRYEVHLTSRNSRPRLVVRATELKIRLLQQTARSGNHFISVVVSVAVALHCMRLSGSSHKACPGMVFAFAYAVHGRVLTNAGGLMSSLRPEYASAATSFTSAPGRMTLRSRHC